jgi:hypothetical protein
MASWRDSTSHPAQDDFDGLFGTVLPFALQTLERRGELFPFGVVVTAGGEVGMRAADPDLGDQPNSNDVLTLLREGVRAERADLRGAAYVADVRIETGDAIRVEMEHSEGAAITILVPYTRSRFKKTIQTGDMRVQLAEMSAWAKP